MSDEKKEKKFARLPAKEQPRDRLYEMSIRFTGNAGVRAIDDMLSQCFPGEGLPRLKDAVTLRLRQVAPFIPDDDTLKEYARIIQESHSKGDTVLDNIRFDGYDYLYAVEEQADGENNGEKEGTAWDAGTRPAS